MADALDAGRDAFARRAWAEAYAELTTADRIAPLDVEDLERLARAAFLVGRDGESTDAWSRAYQQLLSQEQPIRAARCAYWLWFGLHSRGGQAAAGGWLARGQRLIAEAGQDCAEQGLLLLPVGLKNLWEGDYEAAYAISRQAAQIGQRFADADVTILSRLLQGQALARLGRVSEGAALLDESMVAVTSSEVAPAVAGLVYCAVIQACHELFDLRRAQEWTAAAAQWCEGQQGLVMYRGQCTIHRTEIMQLHGAWTDALDEVRQACQRFIETGEIWSVGAAFYQQGDLHRLRGEFDHAEEAYREASRRGRDPQPGLALLRLTQGQVDAAAAAIRRSVGESSARAARARLLPAYVEILVAAGDVDGARAGVEELQAAAAELDAPLLYAVAAHAEGAVLLAAEDPAAALSALRRAWKLWQELDVPYEAGRVRVLLAQACRAIGDEDTARMELDAARWVFQQLGAVSDVARVEALAGYRERRDARLTEREIQVLRLVAAGKTNRGIAGDLFLSEKTVARHMSNILTKLDLPSRSAATAYAYENGLV